jgi:cytochrome c556
MHRRYPHLSFSKDAAMTRIRFAATAFAMILADAASAHGDAPADPSDPVSLRMHIMMNVGAAMGMAGKMAKGEQPYDTRVAEAAFRIMNAAALGMGDQFPEGAMTEKSEASPKIWSDRAGSDRAGFDAAVAKFIADTAGAAAAKPASVDAFKPLFCQLAGN